MRRRLVLAVLMFLVLTTATAARAGWGDFWHRVGVDWHRMNCWPEPFQNADRELVVQPLIAMTDAGWRLQNTLSDHFFDAESHALTQAGRLKVRWIATQTPLHRRTVFVLRGELASATAARVDSVQRYLDVISPEGPRPEVFLTDIVPPGGSGDYFDAVDKQMKSSIPAPRLPEMQDNTGSGN